MLPQTKASTTGRSLLYYAALANEPDAVRLLLERHGTSGIDALAVAAKEDLAMGETAHTPLMNAMVYGSFEVAKQLLEARADTDKRIPQGQDALMLAAVGGRHDNIQSWLNHFGGSWDLGRVDLGVFYKDPCALIHNLSFPPRCADK